MTHSPVPSFGEGIVWRSSKTVRVCQWSTLINTGAEEEAQFSKRNYTDGYC